MIGESEMKKSEKQQLRMSSGKYKFQAPSWPEVREALELAVTKIGHHVDDFSGGGEMRDAMQKGPMLNCVLIWFLTLPRKKQVAIVRQGRKGVNFLMHRKFDKEADGAFTFDMNEIRAAWNARHGVDASSESDRVDEEEHATVRGRVVSKAAQQKHKLRA